MIDMTQKTRKLTPRRRVFGRYWRLVIPALSGYGTHPPRDHRGLTALKAATLDLISVRESARGLDGWCVAWQTHPGTGLPHLDILLTYSKRVANPATRYDYLVKHGSLTRYRSVNAAILSYGLKQDKTPLTNIDVPIRMKQSRVRAGDLYPLMEQAMLKDPYGFQPCKWLDAHDLYRAASATNVYKAMRLVRDRQQAVCHRLLRQRPGVREITREVVVERLTPEQLAVYDSWGGYAVIVGHINQIPRHGWRRPHKSQSLQPLDYMNLYVCGRPGVGKTALAMAIGRHCAVYPLGTRGGWFPSFQSRVYLMMVWDEFNLKTLPYGDLLKLLQGRPMELPVKGGHARRGDSQLIYMTSNLPLESHICKRFSSEQDRCYSRANLRERITQVQVPDDLDLFLLLKLIVPVSDV